MSKKKKNVNNVGGAKASDRIELPYYNSYPDDDLDIEFVNEDEERKQKRKKALTIGFSVAAGVLAVLCVAGFFLLRHFVFYPKLPDAARNAVASWMPNTDFDFSDFEKNGQSTVTYSYDGISVSSWETHKGTDLSKRLTVQENGETREYRQTVKNKELAFRYGGDWYGAGLKSAEQGLEASELYKQSASEATYLMTCLEYISRSSAADKDAKITENFIRDVFESSAISASEDFRGLYAIFDTDRYVKSRSYVITNENLAEFIDNIVIGLRGADITVQTAFRNYADANFFFGTKSFGEMLTAMEEHADAKRAENDFQIVLEICYSGQNLSAVIVHKRTTVSEEETVQTEVIADLFANGIRISVVEKTKNSADESKNTETASELKMSVQTSETGTVYRLMVVDEGASVELALSLNKSEGSFELTARCGETEAFRASGLYSDTREQLDLKCTSLVRNGKEDTEFRFAVTFYYMTTDIELPVYKDILSMNADELDAMKSEMFELDLGIPSTKEEIYEFFGLDKLIEDAKAELNK